MRSLLAIICVLALCGVPFWAQDYKDINPEELYQTALLYETGNDTLPADITATVDLLRLSAEKGYAPARNYLGFLYYNGEGVAQNTDSALYWIRKAAGEGDIKAAGNLGYLLSQAPDVAHDYQEACKWLKMATEAGLPTSFTQLADLKRQGLGCQPDTLGAISLYEKAIEARIPDAQLRLLAMMGYKWKELPADSALSLGLRYYTGYAPVAGVDLLETAAQKGSAKAMALLGDAYSRGIGVEYDHQRSISYFRKAAREGNPSAQFILAELLDFFPDDDEENAQYWYEKAAAAGVADSETAYSLLLDYP